MVCTSENPGQLLLADMLFGIITNTAHDAAYGMGVIERLAKPVAVKVTVNKLVYYSSGGDNTQVP